MNTRTFFAAFASLTVLHAASAASDRDALEANMAESGKIYARAPNGIGACIAQMLNNPNSASGPVTQDNPIRCRIGGAPTGIPALEGAAAPPK